MDAVEEAFLALRRAAAVPSDRWQTIYRSGLVTAFQERRFDEAAELAVFAANALESQGQFEAALEELDFALSQEPLSPDVAADLLVTKALFLAMSGSEDCAAVLDSAVTLREAVRRPTALLALDAQSAMVEFLLLKPTSVAGLPDFAARARAARAESHSLAVEAMAIPFLVAQGDLRRARPWAVALLARAHALGAHYRAADVSSVSASLHHLEHLEGETRDPAIQLPRNSHAAFKARTSAVRAAVLRGDREQALHDAERITLLFERVNPGFRPTVPILQRAVALMAAGAASAQREAEGEVIEPPALLTLVNLPGVLAAIETSAMNGRQDEAVMWDRWLEESWPAHIVTSLEWGASIERLRALLELRLGRESAGLVRMQRAMEWARRAGFRVEAHLAEIQLAETLGLVSTGASSRRWRELREQGRVGFRAVGGDPLPFAYAVSDAIAVGRLEGSEPKLTPREVEVLSLFAEGLSYKEAGRRLGIEWRTVQVHAKHIYGKLGVHGKIAAMRRAEELGII